METMSLADFMANKAAVREQVGIKMPLAAEVSGPKYVRVFSVSGTSRSALFFIDRQTGSVYGAASWKSPKQFAIGGIRVTL